MSGAVECLASRHGRTWVAFVPEHGVYGHGRTLNAVRKNIESGLALLGVSAAVTVTPRTPELEALRAAEDAYERALDEAVAALYRKRTSLGDIALAAGVPVKQVKLLLAEQATDSTSTTDVDTTELSP